MKNFKKRLAIIVSLFILSIFPSDIFAESEDFLIDTNTEIIYSTGDDFVTVKTTYTRKVENKNFYFPATGEKTFHIPDMSGTSDEEIQIERSYKLEGTSVTDQKGSSVKYSVEQQENGEGIYIVVPNYKSTSSSSPYEIVFTYKTHDFITKIGNYVSIIGTSLPKDTVFSKIDSGNGTTSLFSYGLSIVTDNNISPLTKAFPIYSKTTENDRTYYKFNQVDRIGNSPNLEFGTSTVYRFELEYKTNKTDSLIPKEYNNLLGVLATNIYEISLPREFSETRQMVYIEEIYPTPKDIYKDGEGNILALFEIPSNQEDKIVVKGYVNVEQDSLEDVSVPLNISFSDYLTKVSESRYLTKYLNSTKYWESQDEYILQEAEILMKDQTSLLDVIKADYAYINEKLEYDQTKATSENERIGAKAALLGGASVCMEYADTMIALLRAQGIPARASIGYANLKGYIQENQVRHQWVQIWIPEYGWFSIDPTFESNNMKMGQMMDRILWEVFNNDSLSNIRIYSADKIELLSSEGYDVKIYGVEDVSLEDMSSYADLISKDEISGANIFISGNTILKTTILGRALIVTVPVLLVFVLITTILVILKKVVRRKKKST